MQRLVILGGTFDPIHVGHLAIASKLYTVFNSAITFMPNTIPPYKVTPLTTIKQRLEMLELALDGDKRFLIDTLEIDQEHYCYTHMTLSLLRKKYGVTLPIYFLVGSDSFITLDTWEYWQDLFNLTNFVVAMRPGYQMAKMNPELQLEFDKRQTNTFDDLSYASGKIYLLDFTPMDVSSTKIRRLIQTKQPISGLVSKAVAEYIDASELYQL